MMLFPFISPPLIVAAPLGITVVEGLSSQTSAEAVGTTITFAETLQENDVVLVFGGNDNCSGYPNPSGYTRIKETTTVGDNVVGACCWYKRMGPTPDTSVTIASFSASGSAHSWMWLILRGVDTVNALDAAATEYSINSTSAKPNSPSITSVTDGAMIISFGVADDDNVTSASLSGYTVAFQSHTDGGSMVGYLIKETAGAINPPQWVTNAADSACGISIAIRPAT